VTPTPVLEIGGSHVTAALIDRAAGRVLPGGGAVRLPLPGSGGATVVDTVLAAGRALPDVVHDTWAVALPGPFDYAAGLAWYEGVGKFEDLCGLDLRGALLAGLGSRARSITFLNDAWAFVLGEHRSGAAVGADRVLGLTLGTGVGSGFLVGGRIVRDGSRVPPEGRADLLTIDDSPLEDTCSRRAIIAHYGAVTGSPTSLDVEQICALARAGQPAARQVLDSAFIGLGSALAPWVVASRIQVVVVGGAIAGSWDVVAPPLTRGLAGAAPRSSAPQLRAARHPDSAALIGAATVVDEGWRIATPGSSAAMIDR